MRVVEPLPADEQRRKAWRAAALAYRRMRGQGAGDLGSWQSARDAAAEAWPDCPDPGLQATKGIAYAATYHGAWFWRPLSAYLERRRKEKQIR